MSKRRIQRSRQSIRLKGYDYSQPGAYFVTMCTQDRAHLFGYVQDGAMCLTDAGRMIAAEWEALTQRFPEIELDAFVVMPDYFHGIIVIRGEAAATRAAGTNPAATNPAATESATKEGSVLAALVAAPTDAAATRAAGTNPAGTNPAGTNPAGTNPAGTNPAGTNPAGTNSATKEGSVPAALVAAPTNAAATRAAATNPAAMESATKEGSVPAALVATPTRSPRLGDIIGAFKSLTTLAYIRGVNQFGWPGFRGRMWHHNYYESIIRDNESMHRIRRYIFNNPTRWIAERDRSHLVAPESEPTWLA